jgi:hypothetical protein
MSRLALVVVPFRRLAPHLGNPMAESSSQSDADPLLLELVAWAIQVASAYTPWETRCLAQAMACKAILRSRGIASTLYLGVDRDDDNDLQAHAWLRCGDKVLTGERPSAGFTVVARFAEQR